MTISLDPTNPFSQDYVRLARSLIPARDPMRSRVIKLLEHQRDRTLLFPASVTLHHSWPGGLADHISQVMAIMAHNAYAIPHVPMWQIPVLAYVHDWEKHYKYQTIRATNAKKIYGVDDYELAERRLKHMRQVFQYDDSFGKKNGSVEVQVGILLERFEIPVTREMSNAIMLCEGGWAPQASRHQLDSLATVLHTADMISSHCFQHEGGFGQNRWKDKTFVELELAAAQLAPMGAGTWQR